MTKKDMGLPCCMSLKKNDLIDLYIVKDQKGKLCLEHSLCEDDSLLPGEVGERGSIRIFSPRRNGIYDFTLGDIWQVKIVKIHLTDSFTKDDRRIIFIRVQPIQKINQSHP